MIKNVQVKITRTEAHTKMSVKLVSSGQGQSVIFIDSSIKKPENAQSCWSNSSIPHRPQVRESMKTQWCYLGMVPCVATGPLFWSQRHEKFKKILSRNKQGWQLQRSWQGWVVASGKADQAINYYECPQGSDTYFHGKRNQRQWKNGEWDKLQLEFTECESHLNSLTSFFANLFSRQKKWHQCHLSGLSAIWEIGKYAN